MLTYSFILWVTGGVQNGSLQKLAAGNPILSHRWAYLSLPGGTLTNGTCLWRVSCLLSNWECVVVWKERQARSLKTVWTHGNICWCKPRSVTSRSQRELCALIWAALLQSLISIWILQIHSQQSQKMWLLKINTTIWQRQQFRLIVIHK